MSASTGAVGDPANSYSTRGAGRRRRHVTPAPRPQRALGPWGRVRTRPAHTGWNDGFQGRTLKRVRLLIGRMFHVGYTVQGVWKLLRRCDWSARVPRGAR
ncbi:winged helix-turn-helix domain-containing protein [Streptomyces sp. NPDC002755]